MEQFLPEQLLQLATNLSMELGIPLVTSPLDLQFVTDCLDAILGGLNPQWAGLQLEAYGDTEQDIERAWRRVFQVCEEAFLEDGQQIVEGDGDIGIEDIIGLYEIMCQGSEVLRQENEAPGLKASYQQRNVEANKGQQRISKGKQTKKNGSNPEMLKKNKPAKKQVKAIKKTDNQRPKTAIPKRSELQSQNLQKQIIEQVTKTMMKTYTKKANPQKQAKIRQKQGTQAVQRAKRNLDYALKSYTQASKADQPKLTKNKTIAHKSNKDLIDSAYMKMVQTKQQKINAEMQDKQLQYYMQLRDKKVAYIRHIHQLIEKLERQRQAQSNKKQRQHQLAYKQQMVRKLETADNLFSDNLQKIQEVYQQRKKVRELQNVGEIELCRQMERTIKQKKMKEMEDAKHLWEAQRQQLHKITSDEQKMKAKLIDMYRKYRA